MPPARCCSVPRTFRCHAEVLGPRRTHTRRLGRPQREARGGGEMMQEGLGTSSRKPNTAFTHRFHAPTPPFSLAPSPSPSPSPPLRISTSSGCRAASMSRPLPTECTGAKRPPWRSPVPPSGPTWSPAAPLPSLSLAPSSDKSGSLALWPTRPLSRFRRWACPRRHPRGH